MSALSGSSSKSIRKHTFVPLALPRIHLSNGMLAGG